MSSPLSRASGGRRTSSSYVAQRWTTATEGSGSKRRLCRNGADGCAKKRSRTNCWGPTPKGSDPGNAEGHQNRVDVAVAAAVVRLPVALVLEAEVLVQGDRGRVPREDVQLELRDVAVAGPVHRGVQERGADAAAAVRGGDHQAEVGDVAA